MGWPIVPPTETRVGEKIVAAAVVGTVGGATDTAIGGGGLSTSDEVGFLLSGGSP